MSRSTLQVAVRPVITPDQLQEFRNVTRAYLVRPGALGEGEACRFIFWLVS